MLALEGLYQLHYLSMKSLEWIHPPILTVSYELSGLYSLLNIC